MCTNTSGERRATVCDLALPFVRSALAADPTLAVCYETKPSEGTEVRVVGGDLATFEQLVRSAVRKAGQGAARIRARSTKR